MIRLVATTLTTVAVAAGTLASAGAQPAPVPTQTPGVLVVGLNLPADGFQVGAAKGNEVVFARGLEIDLARALGKELGAEVRFFQQASFERLLAAGAKPWDLALSQVTITAGRRQRVDFSIPYLDADQGVLLRRNLGSEPKTIAALRGLKLCSQRKTTGANLIGRTIKPTVAARLLPSFPALVRELQGQRCDAVIYDAPILANARADAADRYGPLVGAIPTGERYGAVLPKGSPLRKAVNRAIARLEARKTLAGLSRRWLSQDLTKLAPIK